MKYRNLLIAAFWTLLALVVLWQYDPVGRKLDADASFMLYAGQQILRGHAPYVGVAIVKLPVSPLVAAAGIASGRLLGLDDILAGRIPFWLCAALSVGAVYLIGAQLISNSRAAAPGNPDTTETPEVSVILLGSLAAAALLSFQALGIQVAEGPEAKFPMICAGLLCLVLLARQKFLWAGITGVLSFLAWQPGLIFVVAAFLAALVVPERKRALLAVLGGVALPLVVIGIYLALNGAFVSMFRQAFGANANYLEEKKVAVGVLGVVAANVGKMWDVSLTCSPTETPLIVLGYPGMLGGAIWLCYRMFKTRDAQLLLAAFPLVLSGAALFGFSLLDLQKCSDVVPLLPYLALGAAGLLFALLLIASRFLARALNQSLSRVLGALGLVTLVVVLFFWRRRCLSPTAPERSRAAARAGKPDCRAAAAR